MGIFFSYLLLTTSANSGVVLPLVVIVVAAVFIVLPFRLMHPDPKIRLVYLGTDVRERLKFSEDKGYFYDLMKEINLGTALEIFIKRGDMAYWSGKLLICKLASSNKEVKVSKSDSLLIYQLKAPRRYEYIISTPDDTFYWFLKLDDSDLDKVKYVLTAVSREKAEEIRRENQFV